MTNTLGTVLFLVLASLSLPSFAADSTGAKGDRDVPTCTAPKLFLVLHNGALVCQPRYVDNGDGTVTDNNTGLMWEKQLATTDAACTSTAQASRNVRCAQNTYYWSVFPSTNPNGTLFTTFLATLNLDATATGTSTCFANHCDWRIPNIAELGGIVLTPFPNCTSVPCIDPTFGPTEATWYWASSSFASDHSYVWSVYFPTGQVIPETTDNNFSARAVRSGR